MALTQNTVVLRRKQWESKFISVNGCCHFQRDFAVCTWWALPSTSNEQFIPCYSLSPSYVPVWFSRVSQCYSFTKIFQFVWMNLFSVPFFPRLLKLPCSLGFIYWCRREGAILVLPRDLRDSGFTGTFSLVNDEMGQLPSPGAWPAISQVSPWIGLLCLAFQFWHALSSSASWSFLSAEVLSRGHLFVVI